MHLESAISVFGDELAKQLEVDPHTPAGQEAIRHYLQENDTFVVAAKTLHYGITYGASDSKLCSMLRPTLRTGGLPTTDEYVLDVIRRFRTHSQQ